MDSNSGCSDSKTCRPGDQGAVEWGEVWEGGKVGITGDNASQTVTNAKLGSLRGTGAITFGNGF